MSSGRPMVYSLPSRFFEYNTSCLYRRTSPLPNPLPCTKCFQTYYHASTSPEILVQISYVVCQGFLTIMNDPKLVNNLHTLPFPAHLSKCHSFLRLEVNKFGDSTQSFSRSFLPRTSSRTNPGRPNR
ncbi:hypothetical protein M758_UG236600 [Ceratodon purpureus]|nr:hypothetical protein M758_UG236600 [Ceratodon purpureus]